MQRKHEPAATPKDGRAARAVGTRAALLEQGRRLFGERGYEATPLGEVCAAANATTGALYHHFRDKKGLFAAVAEMLDAQLVQVAQAATARAAAGGAEPWDGFLAAVDAVLQAGTDPAGRRIGLVDAPAVLGADGWLAIRERHGLGAMTATLRALQSQGIVVAGDPVRLARLVLGLLYGAMESLPPSARPGSKAAAETRVMVHGMLEGLRVQRG